MAALAFGRRRRTSIVGSEPDAQDNVSVQTSDVPPGALVNTLHTPTEISAANLMGRMPRREHILLDRVLNKLTSQYKWKELRTVLTAYDIRMSQPGEDVMRDCIPLKEILDIKSKTRPPIPNGVPFMHKAESSRDILSQDMTDDLDPQIIQIRTMEAGFNSGRTYYLRADSSEDCTNWVKQIRAATKAAAENSLAHMNLARKMQRWLQLFYSSKWTQLCVGILISISFTVNIVQTELDIPPDSAQQQLADSVFTWFEIILTSVFTVEVLVNAAANWFWPFVTDAWSVFDAVIIVISILSLTSSAVPGITALRLVRTLRVMRLFGRLSSLRQIIRALSASVVPVLNAFFVMGTVVCIFSVAAFDLFSDKDVRKFGTFSRSLFTMVEVVTGDAWGSDVARPLYIDADGVVTPWVPLFFVTFMVICGWTLLQVVVAVLLDNFMTAASREKHRLRAEKIENQGKSVDTSALDPLLSILANFGSLNSLRRQIQELFQILDLDDSNTIDYQEMYEGLKKFSLRNSINFMPDEFEEFTDCMRLCNEQGHLGPHEFERAMRRQLIRFVQDKMNLAMRMSDEAEAQSMFFVMKMLMMNMEEVRDNSIEVSLPKQMVKISGDAENFDSAWAIQKHRSENCSKSSVAGCKVCTQELILQCQHCARENELNIGHSTTGSFNCDGARTPSTPSLVGEEVADLDSSIVKGDEDVPEVGLRELLLTLHKRSEARADKLQATVIEQGKLILGLEQRMEKILVCLDRQSK